MRHAARCCTLLLLLLAAAASLATAAAQSLTIEGVKCPSAVVDVRADADFPADLGSESVTLRVAPGTYTLPGEVDLGAGVTLCVVGAAKGAGVVLQPAPGSSFPSAMFFLDNDDASLGLRDVALRGTADAAGTSGVFLEGDFALLGAERVTFTGLEVGLEIVELTTAALRDAAFVRCGRSGVRAFGLGAALRFSGRTTVFTENRTPPEAGFALGAAVACFEGSSAVFEGPVLMERNAVSDPEGFIGLGGGLLATGGSAVEFRDRVEFRGNRATRGGAMYLNAASVTFAADVVMDLNRGSRGYAGYLFSSSARFGKRLDVTRNFYEAGAIQQDLYGAFAVLLSDATFGGPTLFKNNNGSRVDDADNGAAGLTAVLREEGGAVRFLGASTEFVGNGGGNVGALLVRAADGKDSIDDVPLTPALEVASGRFVVSENQGNVVGGVALQDVTAVFGGGEVSITRNVALNNAGGLFVATARALFDEQPPNSSAVITISSHRGSKGGEALGSGGGSKGKGGGHGKPPAPAAARVVVSGNRARGVGGALAFSEGKLVFAPGVSACLSGNVGGPANDGGAGALSLRGRGTARLTSAVRFFDNSKPSISISNVSAVICDGHFTFGQAEIDVTGPLCGSCGSDGTSLKGSCGCSHGGAAAAPWVSRAAGGTTKARAAAALRPPAKLPGGDLRSQAADAAALHPRSIIRIRSSSRSRTTASSHSRSRTGGRP